MGGTVLLALMMALTTVYGTKTTLAGEHHPHKEEQVEVLWSWAADDAGNEHRLYAKKNMTLLLQLRQADHSPITGFDVQHEKMMHMIVLSKDLSYFNHIHPQYVGDGRFEVSTAFPGGGDYKLFADFVPSGGAAVTATTEVHVKGDSDRAEGEAGPGETPLQKLTPDKQLAKTVGGLKVELAWEAQHAGDEAQLVFKFTDARTQQPIDHLQPYLGAVGHVVILSADAEQYLHVHAMNDQLENATATFMTVFPEQGMYKLWGQFQYNNQVITVPFVIQIK